MMKTIMQSEILIEIRDALYHFAGNRNDYSAAYNRYNIYNTEREYVILSNTSNYNENNSNIELTKLINYLRKFSIPFFDYKVIDAIALSHDNILKLLALLRIEGY